MCIALCTIVAHNIAQNRPDSFSPYPPDNHHSSDDVYLREGGEPVVNVIKFLVKVNKTGKHLATILSIMSVFLMFLLVLLFYVCPCVFIMAALCNRGVIIFWPCSFFLSSTFVFCLT